MTIFTWWRSSSPQTSIGWLAGMSVDEWAEDEKTRRAVLQLLTTMGEAARTIDLVTIQVVGGPVGRL